MNDAGSIAFTTQIDQVVDSNVNEITVTGAWTTEPAAWRSLKRIDRPPSPLAGPDQSINEIFASSRLYTRLTVDGKESSPWVDMSHLLAEDGKSREDYESPRAVRLLSLTRATAMSELGGTLSVTGTVPSSWALEALELDYHLDGLGFGGRFDDSTTRVLITVGDDGLPQTLRLEGSGVDVSKADLPDYVVEELAQARHFTTYDEAELDDPIEAPRSYVVP